MVVQRQVGKGCASLLQFIICIYKSESFTVTMPNFSINTSRLEIDNAALGLISVDLGWPIAQVLPVKSTFIVRTDPEPGSLENRNVCAIDPDGVLRWRVNRHKTVYGDSPYTNIELKDGKLILSNWDGLTLVIDPDSFDEVSECYGR